jgi:hypothetical protein
MERSAESAYPKWLYRTTWKRDRDDAADRESLEKHLDEMAGWGWELVSANAVQCLTIGADEIPGFGVTTTKPYSTFFIRHYFYWRKDWKKAVEEAADTSGSRQP